ncbi:MAG TPA: radical SAM family heme chaperone HemW [Dissulfurispiraceae bacterium]|nr:radical SAM family heme chaperone HemW [Dissulfurispiraceae bacterium]
MVSNLYIHIPFCLKKCAYCDFYSVYGSEAVVHSYIEALCREIEMQKDHIWHLETIYIGGGTPSILKVEHIAMIMDLLQGTGLISAGAEITSEANPGTLNEGRIKGMLAAGINRISIGVQSLRDSELAVLGRMHDAAGAENAFRIAREGGFGNISADLIYGIPGQDLMSWKDTLERTVLLRPEHISTYELTPEKNTVLFEKLEKGHLKLPDEEIVTDMYNSTIAMLEDNGYVHYEISNFALPGRECRHNLNYWNRGEYLGIGAGAHSFEGGRRTADVSDVDRYIAEINENRLPIAEELTLTIEDELDELLFLGLRKTEGFDLGLVSSETAARLKKAPDDRVLRGLVELSGNHIRLTKKGLLFCNEVIVRIMLDIERHRPS